MSRNIVNKAGRVKSVGHRAKKWRLNGKVVKHGTKGAK